MLMILLIQGIYVHMVFIYIPSNAYLSVHVLRVLLRGIDNVYVLKVLMMYQQCLLKCLCVNGA